jgi:pre-mRNA-splicing factor 38A
MANRTDPLAAQLSGQDPQNLIEYITRQKIYDSRYWKETCFGLTIADVLEKACELETIGGLPTPFLSLLLKLLQLNAESELIIEGFIEQDQFKYARALGVLYLRLTGRPADIYETLEPLYADHRKLRYWESPYWSIKHMDELIHDLFTESFVCGITLPRLPSRKVMQEGGYLPEGPRETELRDVLLQHGGPLDFLKFKALEEKFPLALKAWEARPEAQQFREQEAERDKQEKKSTSSSSSSKPKKKKARNYDNLFKKSKTSDTTKSESTSKSTGPPLDGGSKEYWDDQRAKLGLAPLRE